MYARLKKVSPAGLRQLAVLLTVLVVAGCSSTGVSRVKTWEGESVGETAILKAPSTIKVREVNGREVGNFLLEDLALDYELKPGTNTVVFTHKTIWAKSGVVRDGESAVHVVETKPQQVVIDARPGEEYRFDVPKLSNRSEAQRFTADFSVAVVGENGSTVARSEPFRGYAQQQTARSDQGSDDSRGQTATPGEQITGVPVPGAQANGSGAGSRLETLEALKMLWERASADEKREFLRWAFD